ncbi:MAG: pentapeptide repeat-containing protein [Planctomycetota bacterium]|nr:pentapeptide repeat-containing protein [Planctomycetota bacterium]
MSTQFARVSAVVLAGLLTFSLAQQAAADIYQWEWVDPGDPSQGIRQSSTVCPGGAGVFAQPGAELWDRDLTQAHLTGANLTGASFGDGSHEPATLANADFTGAQVVQAGFAGTTSKGFTAAQLYSTASYKARDLRGITLGENDLTGWNLANQNLTGASFGWATLTNADFTDAQVAEARFDATTSKGFTSAQLYSTASYKARDLHGINLANHSLSGWNFTGQNLTGASFGGATLTNADFTNSLVAGASFVKGNDEGTGLTAAQIYSTASYKARDLHGIWLWGNDLTGWNFANQNLTGATFLSATLTNADFTDAQVAEASFEHTTVRGFTAAQLYSTASYKARNLHGIGLSFNNNLTGWNFANQNLTGADFGEATLISANLSGANLTWARFWKATLTNGKLTGANLTGADFRNATLTKADLSFADLRGAGGLNTTGVASLRNTIMPDGTIRALALAVGETVLIRDYDGGVPIKVLSAMTMDPTSVLEIILLDPAWGSTISFAAGIPVTLGGDLRLSLAPGTDPTLLIGDTFRLFDWTGVSPAGQFNIVSDPALVWDTFKLYSMGDVTLLAVPEPATLTLLVVGVVATALRRGRRSPKPLM